MPATNYIYLPVPSVEMKHIARKTADSWAGEIAAILENAHLRGWQKGASRMFGYSGCLRNVAPSDRLFVIIHKWHEGSVGASRHPQLKRVQGQWAHQSDDVKEYTPASLARTIQKEGLHPGFTELYACICDSARGVRPFAQGLRDALMVNYPGIEVTGFLGSFQSTPYGNFIQYGPSDIDDRELLPTARTVKQAEHAITYST